MKRWSVAVCVLLVSALRAEASDACIHHCPPYGTNPFVNAFADVCRAAEAHCLLELASYKLWFAQVSAGVTMEPLPQLYVDLLRGDYPNVDLAEVRWGHSSRQASRGITDCTNIYFFNINFARRLRDAQLTSDDEPLLFHELRHAEQCREVGGRDHFAVMWWRHLDTALEQTPHPDDIHDLQPMEADANQREADLPAEFPQGLIPIAITDLFPSIPAPHPVHHPVRWTVEARGARRTKELAFRVERDGTRMAEQPFGDAATFDWTPAEVGTYTVTAEARQRDSALAPAADARTYVVAGAGGRNGFVFTTRCPTGAAMIGVDVRAGTLIDAVAPRCVAVTAAGTWRRRQTLLPFFEETLGTARGGTGGTPVALRCPVDSFVTAILGRSGDSVDQLRLECHRPGRRPSLSATAGGTGGTPFRIPCPAGQRAEGVQGRANTVVNQIDLLCTDPGVKN